MNYWIDGYNLILRQPDHRQWTLEQSRERLLRSLDSLKIPVQVFFDAQRFTGTQHAIPRSSSFVSCRFIKSETADDAIVAGLRQVQASEVTVVTDDRELRLRCRQLGANTVGVMRFMERLNRANVPASTRKKRSKPDRKPDSPSGGNRENLSSSEVDDWMDYFGLDEDWKPD